MQKDIHPKTNKVIFLDTTSNTKFYTESTMSSKETIEEGGTTWQVIKVDTSSASHIHYQKEKDRKSRGSRIESFKNRQKKHDELIKKAKAVKKK